MQRYFNAKLTRSMHASEDPHRTCQVQNCGIDPIVRGCIWWCLTQPAPARDRHLATSATRHGARSCAVGPMDTIKSKISTVYERTCSIRHSQSRCCCLSSRKTCSQMHTENERPTSMDIINTNTLSPYLQRCLPRCVWVNARRRRALSE